MSTITVCDFCGEPIEGRFFAKISVSGIVPDDGTLGWQRLDEFYGHYHAEPLEAGGRSCLGRVEDGLLLAQEAGPSLERIPTISNQRVAARRRKHRKEA